MDPDLNPIRAKLLVTIMVLLIASCAGLTYVVIKVPEFPDALFGLLAGVIGALLTKFSGAWDYFFATSAGSAAKERIMATERIAERSADRAERSAPPVAVVRGETPVEVAITTPGGADVDHEVPIFVPQDDQSKER